MVRAGPCTPSPRGEAPTPGSWPGLYLDLDSHLEVIKVKEATRTGPAALWLRSRKKRDQDTDTHGGTTL